MKKYMKSKNLNEEQHNARAKIIGIYEKIDELDNIRYEITESDGDTEEIDSDISYCIWEIAEIEKLFKLEI